MTAVLDSGAGITIMSEKVAAQLQAAVPDVRVVTGMARAHPVKLADRKCAEQAVEDVSRTNRFAH